MREGWHDGPPSGKCPFGVAVHTDTVMAVICAASGNPARGECRNMTDHRHDAKTVGVDTSEQLSGS